MIVVVIKMLERSNLLNIYESIKKERLERRKVPIQVNEMLKELKKREPDSDKPFFRLAIIGYEIGKSFASLEHAIVYYERFNQGIVDSVKERNAYLKNAQVEIGDCFTQLQLLCETYGFDIDETRLLGAKHLAERHEDFKVKGWYEIE